MSFAKNVMESGAVLNALFIIGFLGIVWLIIYGNLSGNLGFPSDSASFTNETITLNDTGDTPASAVGLSNPVLSSILMTNASGGEVINVGNYTVTGAVFTNATSTYGGTEVNVSYTVTYDSNASLDADGVINNLTTGATTFFGFAPIWFTITAIVLLVLILVGLLAVVMKITKMQKSSGFGG